MYTHALLFSSLLWALPLIADINFVSSPDIGLMQSMQKISSKQGRCYMASDIGFGKSRNADAAFGGQLVEGTVIGVIDGMGCEDHHATSILLNHLVRIKQTIDIPASLQKAHKQIKEELKEMHSGACLSMVIITDQSQLTWLLSESNDLEWKLYPAVISDNQDSRQKKTTLYAHFIQIGDTQAFAYHTDQGLLFNTSSPPDEQDLINSKIFTPELSPKCRFELIRAFLVGNKPCPHSLIGPEAYLEAVNSLAQQPIFSKTSTTLLTTDFLKEYFEQTIEAYTATITTKRGAKSTPRDLIYNFMGCTHKPLSINCYTGIPLPSGSTVIATSDGIADSLSTKELLKATEGLVSSTADNLLVCLQSISDLSDLRSALVADYIPCKLAQVEISSAAFKVPFNVLLNILALTSSDETLNKTESNYLSQLADRLDCTQTVETNDSAPFTIGNAVTLQNAEQHARCSYGLKHIFLSGKYDQDLTLTREQEGGAFLFPAKDDNRSIVIFQAR